MLYRTSSNLDDTLDQCIDRLQGGVDIATCLQENQQLADELKPLLQVAAVLPGLPAPQLSQQARDRIRKQMLQAVKTQEQATRRLERRRSGSFGFAMRFALILVVVMLAMGSGVAAAQSSVPGDALYPVKRGSEQVRLAMATRQADRAALHLQLAETRFAEINTLLERGRQPDLQLITDLSGEYDAAWNDIHTMPVADSAPLYAVYVATLEHHVDLARAAAATASPEQGVQFAATLAASESALVRAHNDKWQNENQRPTPNTPGITPDNTGEQNPGTRPDTPGSTVQPGANDSNGNNGANQGNNGQNSAAPPATNNGNGGQNGNGNNGNNGGQNNNGSQIGTPPNPSPTDGTNNNGNNGNNNGTGGQNGNGNNGNNGQNNNGNSSQNGNDSQNDNGNGGQNGNGSQTDTPANPQPGPNPGDNGNGNDNGSDPRPDMPANPGATDGPGNGNNGNGNQNGNGNNGNGNQNDNGNNGNGGSVTAVPQATTEAAPTEAALATAEPIQPTDAPTDSPAENGNNGNGNNGGQNGNGNNGNGNNGNGNGNGGGDGSNGQNGNGNNGNGNGRNRP